jgi:bla regulator protein BlaR1
MNLSFPELEKFINWLLICSAQAGLLVLMVLLVQRVFRRRLASRWRFALWWVVLIRLVLPVGPESALAFSTTSACVEKLRKPGPRRHLRRQFNRKQK